MTLSELQNRVQTLLDYGLGWMPVMAYSWPGEAGCCFDHIDNIYVADLFDQDDGEDDGLPCICIRPVGVES